MGLTLGIETSCDETSVAVVDRDGTVLSNVVHSQVEVHSGFGGVVPELAARDHLERLPRLLDLALDRAAAKPTDLELIAVTRGPGLAGCLLVGTGVAEGLSAAWSVPLTGVNHLWGHIYAALLSRPDLQPPLLALLVSGAHSDLVRMPEHGRFEVIGRTRDDAAGEAFDKAARMLGLGFPGGPALDRLARTGDSRRQRLPRPALPGLEYSFSGLKTALLYRLRDLGTEVDDQARADLAAAFEESVVESLLAKLDQALEEAPAGEVVVCGGVAANTLLRRRAAEVVAGRARLTIPPLDLCTDNAAMIAAAGYREVQVAGRQPATVDPSLGWGVMSQVKGWEVVFRGERLQADLVAAVLQANGITVEVFGDTAYSVAVNFTEARVLVPEQSAEQAKELIKQAEKPAS